MTAQEFNLTRPLQTPDYPLTDQICGIVENAINPSQADQAFKKLWRNHLNLDPELPTVDTWPAFEAAQKDTPTDLIPQVDSAGHSKHAVLNILSQVANKTKEVFRKRHAATVLIGGAATAAVVSSYHYGAEFLSRGVAPSAPILESGSGNMLWRTPELLPALADNLIRSSEGLVGITMLTGSFAVATCTALGFIAKKHYNQRRQNMID